MSEYIIKIEPNHRPRLIAAPDDIEAYASEIVGKYDTVTVHNDLRAKYPGLRLIISAQPCPEKEFNSCATMLRRFLKGGRKVFGTALLFYVRSSLPLAMPEDEATDIREFIEWCYDIEFEEGEEE